MTNHGIAVERIVLYVAAALSGLVAIFDMLGLLTFIPWLEQRIAPITLLLLASLTAFVLSSLSARLRSIDRAVSELGARIDEQELDTFRGLLERIDPEIQDLLGHYITRLVGTLEGAVTKREVMFNDVSVFSHFWKGSLKSFQRPTWIFTSLPYERYFWKTGTYEDDIRTFIEKKGKMKRIFFLNGLDELSNKEINTILTTHVSLGVEVYVTDANDVPPHLYRLFSADTKKRIGCEVITAATKEIVRIQATSDPSTIETYLGMFEQLLQLDATQPFEKENNTSLMQ